MTYDITQRRVHVRARLSEFLQSDGFHGPPGRSTA